ncbi:26S proteasome non-ATPase regulatory subunit 13 isoform X1 [Bubalus kerabau]|uniref:26S proteasome non-ATPase regulatory subunit 13 isoform X1 n=1 Tax=Bubalus carabanensis TaxID=3119969 RepID=UPI00244EE5E8|nr:26S proteasome non-ATPase regulatory subunit 13 isoform X1 [Bubalus carabanensis]
MKDVPGFLQQSQSSGPGQAAVWHRLEELYTKKLWHQLTLQVLDFVQDPCFAQGDGLIKLYENFISEFEHRVNPLSLVEIILHVVRQMTDPNVALSFLEKTREKVKSSDEAVILCKTAIGALKLNIGDLQVTKESCKNSTEDPPLPSPQVAVHIAPLCPTILCCVCVHETIEDVEEMLSNLPGVTSVHSRFYDLSSKYYQTIGNHASYYKDALRFLGCVDIKDLPVSEQQERAFTLGLAGLLGEGVFNFGELLMHPVLESLRDTDRQWLIDTLYAFNSGNVEQFQTLKTAWGQQPDLAANEAQLLRKIQLLCLMEMTFTRPANHRQLTFEEIAKSAKITVNEVELLVMKALSVGLVKGSIDEVDKRVHMTWVQPRVLDLQQIKGMKDRLEFWCTDVKSMEMLVEHQAHDILT